jgi:hypothetical protein
MQALVKTTVIAVSLSLLLPLTGCSSFSKTARQQRAYEKYVRKSSIAHAKQQSHFRSAKPKIPKHSEESEPVETTSVGPETVSNNSGE